MASANGRSNPQSPIPNPRSPVATLMWLAPLLLLGIGGWLISAGLTQRGIARDGVMVWAVVDSVDLRQRAEITRGAAYLRYRPPGAQEAVVRVVELPLTYLQNLETRIGENIPIRVGVGTDQIVLAEHARGQWVMTLAFAAMSFLGAAGLAWMVGSWNRLLAREGDPAERRR